MAVLRSEAALQHLAELQPGSADGITAAAAAADGMIPLLVGNDNARYDGGANYKRSLQRIAIAIVKTLRIY